MNKQDFLSKIEREIEVYLDRNYYVGRQYSYTDMKNIAMYISGVTMTVLKKELGSIRKEKT